MMLTTDTDQVKIKQYWLFKNNVDVTFWRTPDVENTWLGIHLHIEELVKSYTTYSIRCNIFRLYNFYEMK